MSGVEKESAPRRETGSAQENSDHDPCKVNSGIPGISGAGDQNCLLPDPEKVRDALAWLRPAGHGFYNNASLMLARDGARVH